MSANVTGANSWTIAAARDALRKGEISAVDLTMSCLTAIDAGDALFDQHAIHRCLGTARTMRQSADRNTAAIGLQNADALCIGKRLACLRENRIAGLFDIVFLDCIAT